MTEAYDDEVQTEDLVLDIGDGVGALILYTRPELRGQEVEVSQRGAGAHRVHAVVRERRVAGRTVFAAVYPDLPEGEYELWTDDASLPREFSIAGGKVSEVDWR